jgi:hypothetical protein
VDNLQDMTAPKYFSISQHAACQAGTGLDEGKFVFGPNVVNKAIKGYHKSAS